MRFNKRVKIGKGLNMNLSKSGIGMSIGGPGLSMSYGKNGLFVNAGEFFKSEAITLLLPYISDNLAVNSTPICPPAPMIKIFSFSEVMIFVI